MMQGGMPYAGRRDETMRRTPLAYLRAVLCRTMRATTVRAIPWTRETELGLDSCVLDVCVSGCSFEIGPPGRSRRRQ